MNRQTWLTVYLAGRSGPASETAATGSLLGARSGQLGRAWTAARLIKTAQLGGRGRSGCAPVVVTVARSGHFKSKQAWWPVADPFTKRLSQSSAAGRESSLTSDSAGPDRTG